MKINIEVDCTPEKAREFLRLPKIEPMQQPVKARVERQALDAVVAIAPAAVLKPWFQLMPRNPPVIHFWESRDRGSAMSYACSFSS